MNTKALTVLCPALLGPILLLAAGTVSHVAAQKPSSYEIERGQTILQTVKEDLKKYYYDPQYRGMDLDARFKQADAKIKEATSLGQILGVIAQVLIELNDSHTFFFPPDRPYRTDYGWQIQMVGDQAFVVAVKPGSDAEAKGLQPGDRIINADGVELTRKNLWVFKYLYNALRPKPGVVLQVTKPDGKELQLPVAAKVKQRRRVLDLNSSDIYELIRESENESRLHRHRSMEFGDDLFIWKMPHFDMSKADVDDFVGKFRKRKALLLDLRGNGGGYEETLLRLIGNVIDHDVKVGDLKSRKEQKPVVAKTRGDDVFTGKIVVLIDSASSSASELFARIIQLEKRGIVIGDVSAGAVMRSRSYNHQLGMDQVIFYGVSITDSDVIMTDGKSLEHAGVVPDELKLPSPADLAAQRDPVMAYAASLLGVQMTPEKAGSLFPIEWRK
jgi:carboxyl-terminal processing protease